MAKILITESIHAVGPELMRAAGHQLVFADRDQEVIRQGDCGRRRGDCAHRGAAPDPAGDGEAAENCQQARCGCDNIDLDYCKEAGIAVTITPDANSLSVAEHAFALLMTLSKNVIPVSKAYREIGFAAKNSKEGVEVSEKTAGVIGLGRIGKRFAHMCSGGFGMRVLAYDPYVTQAPEGWSWCPAWTSC